MSDNLATWEALCRPPAEALKRIGGGRLSGMSPSMAQGSLFDQGGGVPGTPREELPPLEAAQGG